MSPSCVPLHARSGGFVDAWRPSLASTPCQRRLGVTILKARRILNARDGQAVMDLRLLVAQMQTDAFAWSTVKVLCSREAVELAAAVQEERARAKAPSK